MITATHRLPSFAKPAATVTALACTPSHQQLAVGDVAMLACTALGTNGKPIQDAAITFTSSNTSVATVSQAGQIGAVAQGSAVITAQSGSAMAKDTITVIPAPPPPPPGTWPNEPSGFVKLTERDFSKIATSATDTAGIDGWDASEESRWPNISIFSDPAAPKSPPSVLRAFYPAGTTGGSPNATPGRLVRSIPNSPQSVYLSVWVKLSANWQANSTGTNKVLYVWINNQPRFFLSAEGSNAAALVPTGRLQETLDDTKRGRDALPPNVNTSARVLPGVWQRWEVVLKANAPGSYNGEFHLWVDGSEVARYTDVGYLASREKITWMLMDVEPIWGGIGDVLANSQTMDFDHIYVSRK